MSIVLNNSGAAHADTIDTSGQAAYEQCGYCHEFDGNSKMPNFPKLAGQNRAYIEKQLRDFKSGKRKGVMTATAELLSDKAIKEVSAYFSEQRLLNFAEPTSLVEKGQKLYRRGDWKRDISACATCHGDKAQGEGEVPGLAGQHASYLLTEIQRFASGERQNDPGAIMRDAIKKLKPEEIQAVVDFLASGAGSRQ